MVIENKDIEKNANLLLYLDEISKFPTLTNDEELALAIRAKQGDIEARERLFNCNLQTIVKIASYYIGYGIEYMDLIQEGNMKLMEIIDLYDPERGHTFNYFLRWRLYKNYFQEFDKAGARNIRVPSWGNWLKIYQNTMDITRDSEYERRLYQELEECLSNCPKIIERAYQYINDTESLEAMLDQTQEYPIIDKKTSHQTSCSVEDEYIKDWTNKRIMDIIKQIPFSKRQIEILALNIGFNDQEPLRFHEIAKMLNISPGGVNGVFRDAIEKIYASPKVLQLLDLSTGIYISEEQAQRFSRKFQKQFQIKSRSHNGVTVLNVFNVTKSKKKIESIIPTLTTYEQELLMKFCAGDLDNQVTDNLTLDESLDIHFSILPKMNNTLEELYRKVKKKN